ncbi:hypothetical protein JQ634_14750 [Bradyrhizobium sp. AUGA SZCCT0240]|uniref:hypothetical protein n=1 Tax=Bradyrhizobium sp. AUGA SZCCT0240 TaxID=2807669 RepID=UPI001BADF883|nr:hypothetical protein [Bradyrhizobium sp. AUGA SZCCT0240]
MWRPKVCWIAFDGAPGAIDDKEAADDRIEPTAGQIVQQRLHGRGTLGGAFDNRQRMLVAFAVDANGGDPCQLIADMQLIDVIASRSRAATDPTTSMRPSVPPTNSTDRRETAD